MISLSPKNDDQWRERGFKLKGLRATLNTQLIELKINLYNTRIKIKMKSYSLNEILFLGEKLGNSRKTWI